MDADDIITKDYLSYLHFLAVKHDCYISSCGYETKMSSGKTVSYTHLYFYRLKIG